MSASPDNYGFVSLDSPQANSQANQQDNYGFTPLESAQSESPNLTPYDATYPEISPEEYSKLSYPERVEYFKGQKVKTDFLHSRGFTQGLASGATLGVSENIPGLKPSEGASLPENVGFATGTAIGSFPVIEFAWTRLGKPIQTLLSKSPYFSKQLSSLGSIIGWGVTGGALEGLKSIGKGEIPEIDDVIEHGTEWALLDTALKAAGATGRFSANLLRAAKSSKQSPISIVNEISESIAKSGKTAPKDISDIAFEIIESKTAGASKPVTLPKPTQNIPAIPENVTGAISQPKLASDLSNKAVKPEVFEIKMDKVPDTLPEIHADTLIKDLEVSPSQTALQSYGQKATSQQQLGQSIQSTVNERFKAAEKEYTGLYNEVENTARDIQHSPKQTIETANKLLSEINSLKTRPAGYQQVINTLNDNLSDMGYHIFDVGGKLSLRDASGNLIKIAPVAITENVPLSKSMELSRRLNKIIDYDIVGPSIKKQLKPIVNKLKKDIKGALPFDAMAKYDTAEQKYAQTAKLYSSEPMLAIRGEANPERITQSLSKPSTYDRVASATGDTLKPTLEREYLEHLNQLNHESALKLQREFTGKLSKEAQKVADSIIESKRILHPASANERSKRLLNGIVTDLSTAFATGQRPQKTLQLWNTPKGRTLVQQAIKSSPNKANITRYLQNQAFFDSLAPAIKDGKLDYKAFNKLLGNKLFVQNVHGIAGQEGVQFLKDLEGHTKRLARNFELSSKILDSMPKEKLAAIRGKYLIEKAKAANKAKQAIVPKETIAAKPILPKSAAEAREAKEALMSKREKGDAILKRMARKDYPLKSKIDSILDLLGLPFKTALSVLFPISFGLKGVGTLVASRFLYSFLSSRAARQAFKKAAMKHATPESFTSSLVSFADALKEVQPSAPQKTSVATKVR